MCTLILASHSIEADRSDLVILEFGTVGELLEAASEWDNFTEAQVRDLDDALTASAPGESFPLVETVGDFVVTFGCVVRS